MSCTSRVIQVDMSVAAGTTLALPTNTEDGYPDTAIRVIDSIVCTMVDDGSGATSYLTINTFAGAAGAANLVVGKTFSANEADTFILDFPKGLPIYDTVDISSGAGLYASAPKEPQATTVHKAQITIPAAIASGSSLTLAHHWAARAQLG